MHNVFHSVLTSKQLEKLRLHYAENEVITWTASAAFVADALKSRWLTE